MTLSNYRVIFVALLTGALLPGSGAGQPPTIHKGGCLCEANRRGRKEGRVELSPVRGWSRGEPVMDVAALLGKSPAYYSVALNRRRALSVELLAKLAAAFGKTIELRLVRR